MKKLEIWQSNIEPDKYKLWFNKGDLLYYSSNGWRSILGSPEAIIAAANIPEGSNICGVYKIDLNSTLTAVSSPVNYSQLQSAIDCGYTVSIAVPQNSNGQSWWYPVTEVHKNGNSIELWVSPGATTIEVIVNPDDSTEVHISDTPRTLPIASQTVLGGVRIMEEGGLLIDREHGDLYVLKSDDYSITSSTAEDTVASLKALNKLAKKVDDLIMDLLAADIETDVQIFDNSTN